MLTAVEKYPSCDDVGFVVGVPKVIHLFPDNVNPLDAVSSPADVIVPVPDDGDETKSLIWVQCRTCK